MKGATIMLLCLDIGNSNITMGLFREGDRAPFHRAKLSSKTSRSSDEYAIALESLLCLCKVTPAEIKSCVLGSVVPSLTGLMQSALARLSITSVLTVGPGVKTGFGIRIDDPSQLGADLVANTAAAISTVCAPIILIDAGTATTISLIDDQKRYCGCVILPGLRASAEVLRETTALLPAVSPSPLFSEESPLGNNSQESIAKGLLWGNAILIDGFIEKFSGLCNAEPKVIATGGSAPLFLNGCQHPIQYDPDLTLKGLAKLSEINRKKKRAEQTD